MAIVLAIIAVGYGFTVIPSPTEQRDKNFDATRVDDLETIDLSIDDYNYDYDQLPQSLQEIDLSTYIYDDEPKPSGLEDPETKAPYEYVVTSPTTYKLCATFGAESEKYHATIADEFEREIDNHPKGYYCFVRELYNYDDTNISPSPLPSPSIYCIKEPCTTDVVPSPTIYYIQADTPTGSPTVTPRPL